MGGMTVLLGDHAEEILQARYYLKNAQGDCVENASALFERVAHAVAQAESRDRKKWAARFSQLMSQLRFLPNSPTLMNAGKPGVDQQLSACFVLPIEDDLSLIFESLKSAALIHQSGGGTGFSFSRLRAKGAQVSSSHGVASGPVSFLEIFDAATEAIKQGGARRGANMGILNIDHPDIREFISVKKNDQRISNFNLSVGMSQSFMEQVLRKEKAASSLFDEIVDRAWQTGDPGLVFLDRIQFFNPTPQKGTMESTNPCGEQPLLPFESCNLGSMNLLAYFDSKHFFHWDSFREDIHLAVRFLDNVIEINEFPLKECKRITHSNRKIGLGVMGFADLLLRGNISYDSPLAREWGERIMSFLTREARRASIQVAKKRGAFSGFHRSMWKRLGYPPLRNATVSTVAPTGTISMLAGVSSGIEPIFSATYSRNVLSGRTLQEVHPVLKEVLAEKGLELNAVQDWDRFLTEQLGEVWSPSYQVSVEGHIEMQAAFQRHSDSAVSKTINLSSKATREEVKQAYLLAYRRGAKGVTVYRDQSKSQQVLVKEDCLICD